MRPASTAAAAPCAVRWAAARGGPSGRRRCRPGRGRVHGPPPARWRAEGRRGGGTRRRQMERTASASSGRRVNSGRTCRARSLNSSNASASPSGGTVHVISPPIANGSRLVATILIAGAAVRRPAATSAAASTRCSQLSSTITALRLARCRPTASARVPPDPDSLTPRVTATWSQRNSPPESEDRSTNQAPSGNRSATAEANCSARRVLPAPPGPVRVSSRASDSRAAAWASSASRPTKRVSGTGRLVAGVVFGKEDLSSAGSAGPGCGDGRLRRPAGIASRCRAWRRCGPGAS